VKARGPLLWVDAIRSLLGQPENAVLDRPVPSKVLLSGLDQEEVAADDRTKDRGTDRVPDHLPREARPVALFHQTYIIHFWRPDAPWEELSLLGSNGGSRPGCIPR
jgi:hypothetical protein